MLKGNQKKEYFKLRKEGFYSPSVALHYAKQEKVASIDWDWATAKAKWSEQGFDIVAEMQVDDDYSRSREIWDQFGGKRKPGSIKLTDSIFNDQPYFYPESTAEELYTFFRMTCTKQVAREKAAEVIKEQIKTAQDYGKEWYYVGVGVSVYKDGVKLGYASLWGIDYYPTGRLSNRCQEYVDMTVRELLVEAVAEAIKYVGDLLAERDQAERMELISGNEEGGYPDW